MKRNMNKLLTEYQKRIKRDYHKDPFFLSDYYQIIEISKGNMTAAVFNALDIGFMVGYRTAKRELKNK